MAAAIPRDLGSSNPLLSQHRNHIPLFEGGLVIYLHAQGKQLMNWDAIGSIAEIAGAIGVIVSLVYLAVQIRSSTKFTKIATVSDSMNSFVQYFREVSGNRSLAELTLKGMADPASLEPAEAVMFTHHVSSTFMIWYKTFLQYESGLLDEDFWKTCERDIEGFFRSPGVQLVWEQIHPSFTPEFVALINSVRLQDGDQSAEFFPSGFEPR